MRATKYAHYRDNNWYVGDGRVEVYSVIASWLQGYSPEEVQNGFPHLSLVEIYGTILFYLEHRHEMDAFFREQDTLFRTRKAEAEAKNPAFYAEMRERIARLRAAQGQQPEQAKQPERDAVTPNDAATRV